MNRTIKFRAKSIFGKWVYGNSLKHTDNATPDGIADVTYIGNKIPNARKVGAMKWIPVEEDTIGEFTGMLDKNGKEIYEGDIMHTVGRNSDTEGKHYYRAVAFVNGCFCMIIPEYSVASPLTNHIISGTLGWEVIGNIHDNPQLIKGGER